MSKYYLNALDWVRRNTLEEQGIIVSSIQRYPYLEVTGYLIPTLIDAKEEGLAYQYAEFLSYMQRPNGSFAGPDGKEYIFDSGQALRGLVRAAAKWDKFKIPAIKCANYIVTSMHTDGQLPANYNGEIPEAVHVFALPALLEAAALFNKPEYEQAARKSLGFYKNNPKVLDLNCLTHFLGYIIDGFIDMGEIEFVKPTVNTIFAKQKSDGSISAWPNVNWVCSVGLAQLGIIAHKLNMSKEADKTLTYLIKIQNKTGGFFGSYGLGAKYFPKEEISWANKFFIDLIHLRQGFPKEKKAAEKLDQEQWHKAMVGETIEQISNRIRTNNFAIWCRPLLERTSPGDSILELGSGTGELAAILSSYGRTVHLLDYSDKSINYAKELFSSLKLHGNYHVADILNDFPLGQNSVDWVFSSGVLEHFTDEQILSITKKSAAVAKKGVMSLVPNSLSLFYRIGKHAQEKSGQWSYGKEIPKLSMKHFFEQAGLHNVQEYSVGTYHALKFWGKNMPEIKDYLDTLTPNELRELNQGYLLFTYGEKHA
jgi:ubiquinone/menaquinone biosynthesis C-methylase UbiE